MNGRLIYPDFDARIPRIDIKPENLDTSVTVYAKVYDEKHEKTRSVKLVFKNVAAIDFRINYFDNMIGAEAMGLYEITDYRYKDSLVRGIFVNRREVYLAEGDYDYNEEDSSDMLNSLDITGGYREHAKDYRLFIQNVDAGVYMILAKTFEIIY